MTRSFINHEDAAKLLRLNILQLQTFVRENDISIYYDDTGCHYRTEVIMGYAKEREHLAELGTPKQEVVAEKYFKFSEPTLQLQNEHGVEDIGKAKRIEQPLPLVVHEKHSPLDRIPVPPKRKRKAKVAKEPEESLVEDRNPFLQDIMDGFSTGTMMAAVRSV